MNMLIIEDNTIRISMFKEWLDILNINYTIEYKHDKLIKLLSNNFYTHILWDHDLGVNMNDKEVSSVDIIKELIKNNSIDKLKTAEHIIHSMNPIGAKNLYNYLKDITNNVTINAYNTIYSTWISNLRKG